MYECTNYPHILSHPTTFKNPVKSLVSAYVETITGSTADPTINVFTGLSGSKCTNNIRINEP